MSQTTSTALDEWKRHWPLVLSGMIGFSFFAVVTYSLGTFMEPLEKQYGWSRAEISFGLTIFSAIQALGGPPMGALMDRFGTRRMALVGMITAGTAFAAFSLANGKLSQWFGLWAVFGFCALMIKSTVWSAGTSSVFTASRGLALAAVLSGSALGQSFAPLIANALINEQGWQAAYRWMGFGWAGLATVLIAFFYFDARDLGRRAAAAAIAAGTVPAPLAAALPGLTLAEALRNSRVIRIAIANLLMSLVGSGVAVHIVPLIAESGVDKSRAVEMAATAGFAGIIGKFLTGWLLDRIQGSIVPFISFAIAAIGHFLLMNLFGSSIALTLGAMALGYASGAGLQVSTYLISRYAGLRNFGAIFGTISSMMMAGAAAGPLLAGYIHDTTGSYTLLLICAAPVMLLCSFLFIGLGAYPVFPKDTVKPQPTGTLAPAE